MSLHIGSKAPNFTLQNTEGKEVSLSDYQGQNNVLLLFFPLAFSSTCTEELCTTRDNMKLYDSFNVKVLGISIDSFFCLKEFKKSQNLNFTLLSDFNKKAAPKYKALYQDYYGMKGVTKRASFIIDKEGVIRFAEVLEDSSNLPDFKAIQNRLSQL
ncbi:MAG: redoxin domain-containing protein [Bacteroidota bacterium]